MSYTFDFDELERLEGRPATISAIKLKAMAMKMRHRCQGYNFGSGKVTSQLSEQLLSSSPLADRKSESECSRSVRSVIPVDGPDNLLGLKTILIHPFCIPLIAVPLGIMSAYLGWGSTWTFWLNFFALVPLAKILGDATEELAASLHNDTISGLLNATFGNAVEMIVSVQSLRAGLFSVVKASLLGSVLSNILLVLGSSFLLGGFSPSKKQRGRYYSIAAIQSSDAMAWRRRLVGMEKEQKFPVKSALISVSMLLFSCMSFALPTIFSAYPGDDAEGVLKVSRIGAWIVGSSYVAFLVFQLLTHTQTLSKDEQNPGGTESLPTSMTGFEEEEEDEEEEAASLTAGCAVALMFGCTLVVSMCSELLVNAIQSVVHDCGIPESFIGVILLPIAGNACEHAAALRFAFQDRPGLAIGISVGSSTQVALLVVPFSVIAGQVMGCPMDLDFGLLNTAVVTLSVLVVLTILIDGRSNWLKGYILVALYVFIAVLYWYIPQLGPPRQDL